MQQIEETQKLTTTEIKNDVEKRECEDIGNQSEVWKEVPSYPKYEVSNLGRVRNKIKGNILSPRDNHGYKMFSVFYNKKQKNVFIHRAVLEAFTPNPDFANLEGHHKDFDKSNNKLENLVWRTPKENMACSYSSGRFKERDEKRSKEFRRQWKEGDSPLQNFILSKFKLKNSDMRNIRYLKSINFFDKQELADLFGVSRYTIEQITENEEFYIKISGMVE